MERLQIKYRNFDESEAVTEAIEKRYEKLERICDRIVSCHVTVSAPHRHHHKGKIYHIMVHVHIPQGDIVCSAEPEMDPGHEDIYVAIRDAFKAVERQLEQRMRRMRDTHVGLPNGAHHARVVKIFSVDGYGFIETADHREIYFHENSVLNGGFAHLNVGDSVEFSEEMGAQGPQVTSMRRVAD